MPARPSRPRPSIASDAGSGTGIGVLISVWPRLSNSPWPTSVPIACSVILNGPGSDAGPVLLWLKLSAAPTAVEVKVSTRLPGVSVGVAAPWVLVGSLNQFRAIVEPLAVCQTPEPDVAKLLAGPAKS